MSGRGWVAVVLVAALGPGAGCGIVSSVASPARSTPSTTRPGSPTGVAGADGNVIVGVGGSGAGGSGQVGADGRVVGQGTDGAPGVSTPVGGSGGTRPVVPGGPSIGSPIGVGGAAPTKTPTGLPVRPGPIGAADPELPATPFPPGAGTGSGGTQEPGGSRFHVDGVLTSPPPMCTPVAFLGRSVIRLQHVGSLPRAEDRSSVLADVRAGLLALAGHLSPEYATSLRALASQVEQAWFDVALRGTSASLAGVAAAVDAALVADPDLEFADAYGFCATVMSSLLGDGDGARIDYAVDAWDPALRGNALPIR